MKKENFENYDYLTEQVFPRFGVSGVFDKKLEAEMDKGASVIQLKAETTRGESKIQFNFRVEKSENDGRHYLNRIDAALTRKDGTVENQIFKVYNQRGFAINQMGNMMEHQSFVYKEYLRDGERKSGWSFIDHNRKDDDGNSIVRTYSDDITKFNLVASLGNIPLGYMDQKGKDEILTALKNGDPVSAVVKMPDGKKEKANLVVLPHMNIVAAYDREGKKINFGTKESKVVLVEEGSKLSTAAAVLEKSENGQELGASNGKKK